MMTGLEENPYRAGPGLIPPHFAGRITESEVINSTIGLIKGKAGQMGRSPFPTIVIVGPRGVGKTVLLERATEFARMRKIHVAEVDRELLAGPQEKLVKSMFKAGALSKVFDKVKSLKLSYMEAGVTIGLREAERDIRLAIPAFLSKKPMLLLLDEAHHCEPELLNTVFGIAQRCMRARLPLALIIAGTPGLEPLLQRCKATYVERYKSLRINTLAQEETKDALELPAREEGRPLDNDALEMLLGWSDCYPYFIQMAGVDAWNTSTRRGGETITLADAKSGLELSSKARDAFYSNRHMELMGRGLDDFALQSARIIKEANDGKIKVFKFVKRLMEMNDGMDKQSAVKTTGDLQDDGFIWLNVDLVEPGIPSMFDHIIREQQDE